MKKSTPSRGDESPSNFQDAVVDVGKLTHLFMVIDLHQSDMKKLLNSDPQIELSEEHILTIAYNSLCALNFLHTANVIHRDLKPANFLIDSTCGVKLCDFGLSRTMPKKDKIHQEFEYFRRLQRKNIMTSTMDL